MEDETVSLAFCPILFAAGGGRFDHLGHPIFEGTKGSCDTAFDCGQCPYLAAWLPHQIAPGESAGWECFNCVAGRRREELPGFYQSGRPAGEDLDNPSLTGCTSCGWASSLLQLVIHRGK